MSKAAFALGRRAQRTGYPEAVQRLKLQTQRLLGLSEDVTVSVTELSCREPGCPDVETVIAILSQRDKPCIARFHKSIPDVTADELKTAFEPAFLSKKGVES